VEIPPRIRIRLAAAPVALFFGTAVLAMPKSTPRHKAMGRILTGWLYGG
jgi:hypothetical protein